MKWPKGKHTAFSHYPWWRKDRWGYPIEFIKGKPIANFVRTIFQNIRKIFDPYRPARMERERPWSSPPNCEQPTSIITEESEGL